LIGGIKNQLLLFALATIIVIALLGTSIPSAFIVLIYVVVLGALLVAALPAIRAALRNPEPKKREAPPVEPRDTHTTAHRTGPSSRVSSRHRTSPSE
jgi:hypothetical protein